MKLYIKALPLLLITILCTDSLYAQNKADKKSLLQLKTDVGYLASDAMEGRRTSSAGETMAAEYIERRYKEEEILPYKGQYRYPFHFDWGKEIGPGTELRIGNYVVRYSAEGFPLPFSANKRVYSDIIPDVMEQGAIWMIPYYVDVDDADDPHFDWEKSMYERSKEAEKQGATGVLFYDGIGGKYQPVFNTQSQLEELNIPVAYIGHDAYDRYVNKGNTFIKSTKGELPVELNIQIKRSDRTGNNIAAYIDNGAKYTVVIGAHYDHLGRGEDGNSLYTGQDMQIHNGADDNASGTAAVLELATWVMKKRLLNYNYLFVNFSGEELGLLGSKAFIKDMKLDSSQVAYMINMDMVGRLNDSTHMLNVGGVGTSPAWGQFVMAPDKRFKIVIDSSGVGPSDHTSFYHANIPVLFFFTGTHKDYHKPSDDADKVNYNGELQVIKYAEEIIQKMDKSPRPAFTATRQTSMGKANFKVTLGIMPDYTFLDGGVRVDGVSENRPAMKAGIKEGDVITKLGAYKVQGMQSYMEALGKFNPGEKTTVVVRRNGKDMELPITFNK